MGKPRTKIDADALRSVVRRLIAYTILLVVLMAGGAWGFWLLRRHVASIAMPDSTPTVKMIARPAWMSDRVASRILDAVQPRRPRSALDQALLKEITAALESNPWVKGVKQVRRTYGRSAGDTIEIACDYRAPMALVSVVKGGRNGRPRRPQEWLSSVREYIMVDCEGYRLPESFPGPDAPPIMLAEDGLVNLRIIDGVAADPPDRPGGKWPGEDLQAGLNMAGFLYGREIAQDLHRIFVGNFAGRVSTRSAQLVLVTKYNSEIRWGEPVNVAFHAELDPLQKLKQLEAARRQFGRIDAKCSWLDIRFEKILCPPEEKPVASAQ